MKLSCLITAVLVFACNNDKPPTSLPEKDSVILNYSLIPAERTYVNSKAIKTYREKTNSADLAVSIYETRETFHYLVKVDYNGLKGNDTLKVPNFGIKPAVEIIKGEKRPSCVIGFLDKDKKFRESKLIYFEHGKLKIHVLKRYAVATYRDTLK